jgi:hypothetical protein
MRILFLLLLVAGAILNSYAYEPKLVASIKIPSDLTNYIKIGRTGIRSTLFLGRAHITFNTGGVSLIVDKDGSFIFARGGTDFEYGTTTNLISTTIENGILKVIQEEISSRQYFQDDGAVAFLTLSPDGYTSIKNIRQDIDKKVFKVSSNLKELVNQFYQTDYKYSIEKFDRGGKMLTKTTYDGEYSVAGNTGQYPTSDFFVSTNIRDDIIDVYFIYPSSNQGNSNKISLSINKISNTTISGTIATSKTNSIKLQSSDDIKNWMDVETVVNPSGKSFSIPLTKPKEFIRAIE